MDKKVLQRKRRHNRVRAKISGTSEAPRLAVFKSNKFIYAQIINDDKGETIVSADTRKESGKSLVEKSKAVGTKIAEAAKGKKISKVVFDRGGFVYTGAIKELAEAARSGGLKF